MDSRKAVLSISLSRTFSHRSRKLISQFQELDEADGRVQSVELMKNCKNAQVKRAANLRCGDCSPLVVTYTELFYGRRVVVSRCCCNIQQRREIAKNPWLQQYTCLKLWVIVRVDASGTLFGVYLSPQYSTLMNRNRPGREGPITPQAMHL